jgi:molecular chaperone DnaK
MMIGLDVGTTNSCAAYFDGRVARMLELDESGAIIMPSVVTIAEGQAHVGHEALEVGLRHPDSCFKHFKRSLAEKWHPDEDTGYQTCEGRNEDGTPNGMMAFRTLEGHVYSPVELTSYVIGALVDAANKRLSPHDTVTGAVICVPADFTQSQVRAVEDAARIAGLTNFQIMKEPTAAALAYGFDAKKARRLAVFDLGGGTFDISIVQTGGGLVDVIANNGIRDVGGVDFDKRIADYVINRWKTKRHHEDPNAEETDLKLNDNAMIRVMTEAEAVKKRLTDKESTEFRVIEVAKSRDGVWLHLIETVDRRTFDELTRDLRERIANACRAAVVDARRDDPNFSVKDLHDVPLVGGMSRVPSVKATAEEVFGKPPRRDESPEQVVAMGAAIRAAIIEGRKPDVTIVDITSHAIAIETVGNVPAILVPRGTHYPFEETFTLSNPDDDQTELSIRLIQADKPRALDCALLWATEISLEPGPAQTARKPLTIRIDASGRPTAECDGQSFEGAPA